MGDSAARACPPATGIRAVLLLPQSPARGLHPVALQLVQHQHPFPVRALAQIAAHVRQDVARVEMVRQKGRGKKGQGNQPFAVLLAARPGPVGPALRRQQFRHDLPRMFLRPGNGPGRGVENRAPRQALPQHPAVEAHRLPMPVPSSQCGMLEFVDAVQLRLRYGHGPAGRCDTAAARTGQRARVNQ
ncbi:MAG TPA: hypothetical protein VF311_04855 [Terriglobales bacterium]